MSDHNLNQPLIYTTWWEMIQDASGRGSKELFNKIIAPRLDQLNEANIIIGLVRLFGSNNLPEGKQNIIKKYCTKYGIDLSTADKTE